MANDQKVKVIIDGENKTDKAFKQADNSLAGFTSTVKKFAVAAGAAFAAKEIFDFGRASVEAFNESEVSAAKVTALLKTLPSTINTSTDAIFKLAGAAVDLGFSDEAAAENIAFLLQRTGDLTKATELNALAMDLARAKNIDLATAGNLVGQVLSGNGRALKQFGIEIDETMTPLEALTELQGKVAGQATAFADTTTGKMEILNQKFGEFQEAVGSSLSEALVPFLDKLIEIAGNEQFIEFIVTLTNLVAKGLNLAFIAFQKTTSFLTDAFTGMFMAMDAVSKFWTNTLIPNVAKVKTAIETLIKPLETVVNLAQRALAAMAELANKTGSSITSGAKSLISKIKGKAEGGPVSGGRPYIVGENGPELFTPNSNGSIIPNHKMGGSSIVINVSGNTLLDGSAGDKIAQQIMYQLRGALRF